MKKALNPKDFSSKSKLKNTSEELNNLTIKLNSSVEQTRTMSVFLIERKKKLDSLKEYLNQLYHTKSTVKNGGKIITKQNDKLDSKCSSKDSNKENIKDNKQYQSAATSSQHYIDPEMTLEVMDKLGW